MGQTAAQMPDEGLAEFHQAHRDAAPVHDFAGQHKERQRHQREAVHAVVKVAV
jgi:trans-aconitate methyltransferase